MKKNDLRKKLLLLIFSITNTSMLVAGNIDTTYIGKLKYAPLLYGMQYSQTQQSFLFSSSYDAFLMPVNHKHDLFELKGPFLNSLNAYVGYKSFEICYQSTSYNKDTGSVKSLGFSKSINQNARVFARYTRMNGLDASYFDSTSSQKKGYYDNDFHIQTFTIGGTIGILGDTYLQNACLNKYYFQKKGAFNGYVGLNYTWSLFDKKSTVLIPDSIYINDDLKNMKRFQSNSIRMPFGFQKNGLVGKRITWEMTLGLRFNYQFYTLSSEKIWHGGNLFMEAFGMAGCKFDWNKIYLIFYASAEQQFNEIRKYTGIINRCYSLKFDLGFRFNGWKIEKWENAIKKKLRRNQ